MKRILMIAFMIVLTALGCAALAEGEVLLRSGDFQYRLLENDTAEIAGYLGVGDDGEIKLKIPAEIDGHAVTRIGDGVFNGCAALKQIVLPDGLTEIGSGAFAECSQLAEIELPQGLISIGDEAFDDCRQLEQMIIPNSVASIGDSAFSFCKQLRRIEIPEGVQRIGSGAFSYCDQLTEIALPDSIIEIGDNPFYSMDALVSISVSPNAAGIELIDGVLYARADQRLVCCPPGLNMARHEIPQGTRVIGSNAFTRCDALEEVVIPDSVTEIGDYAFSYCKSLTELAIPASVTKIGVNAFDDWTVTLCVEEGRFAEQYAIENGLMYGYPDGTYGYKRFQSGAFEYEIRDDGTAVIVGYLEEDFGEDGVLEIPAELDGYRVTRIGADVFQFCSNLEKVVIPEGVTEIGANAFGHCDALEEVVLPDGLNVIEEAAFCACTSLVQISIPESVTFIGDSAFICCESLTEIVIPDGVTRIADSTFGAC